MSRLYLLTRVAFFQLGFLTLSLVLVFAISSNAISQDRAPTTDQKAKTQTPSGGTLLDTDGKVVTQGFLGETDQSPIGSGEKVITSGNNGDQSASISPVIELKPVSGTPSILGSTKSVLSGNCTPSASAQIATPPTPCQGTLGSVPITDKANYNLVCQGMPPGSCSFSITLEDKNTTTNTIETSFTGTQSVNCGQSFAGNIQILLTPQIGTHRVTVTVKDSAGNVLAAASCVYTVQ